MAYTAGIDIGANYAKVVILDEERKIVGKSMIRTGFNYPVAAEKSLDAALEDAGLKRDDIAYVAATGFGRYMVPFRDIQITELTCHAKGAWFMFPNTRTVLDVGGSTIKAIRCDDKGKVKAFRLNDKCAAGTGAFLEKTARYMGYDTGDIAALAEKSQEMVSVSSVCAVFAESEVINHLSSGKKPEDIMNGSIVSLAGRAAQLMKRVGMEKEYTVTGGMTRIKGFVDAMAKAVKSDVNILADDMGQWCGALGAAILSQDRVRKLAQLKEASQTA